MEKTLKERTAQGLLWGAVNNGLTQLLNILFGIWLARLLSPGEYGMVGMIAIFSAIASVLQESGFTSALTNMKAPTDKDYNAVFWFSTLMGASLYLIFYCCAPLIAAFLHQPALVELSRVVFLGFFIASLGTVHAAHMFRHMMNREKTIMGTCALLSSGSVGVVMACNGFSYWSLAAQQLVYITVVNIFRYYYVRWRPSLRWDFTPIREIFAFSSKILVTNIINCFSANIFALIFGRLFTERVVGNYTQANKWNTMGYSFVSGTLQQIAQPVLASVSDEQERQLRIFRKILRFTAFLAFPAMLGLAAVAQEFIAITIGEKWADSAVLLQILCISGAFMPLHTLYQNLAISKKRSDIYMWCNITLLILQVSLILACRQLGITAMVTVYSAIYVAWILVWQLIAQRLIGIRFLEFLKDILPFLLAAGVNIGAVYWLTNGIPSPVMMLLCRIVACAILYFLTLKIAHAKILEECMNYLLHKHKNETR